MTHAVILYTFVVVASLTALLVYMIAGLFGDLCDCDSAWLVANLNVISTSVYLLPLIVFGGLILFSSMRACHSFESWFSIGLVQYAFISWILLVIWWIGHVVLFILKGKKITTEKEYEESMAMSRV